MFTIKGLKQLSVFLLLAGVLFSQNTPSDIIALNKNKDKIKASSVKSITKIEYGISLVSTELKEKSKTVFEYDAKGRLVKKISHAKNSLESSDVSLYDYDNNDVLIKETRSEFKPDGSKEQEVVVSYFYDTNGRLIGADYYYDRIRKNYLVEKFSYDGNANIVEYYKYDYINGEFVEKNKYDSRNNIIANERYKREDGIDTFLSATEYENKYDSLGRLIQTTENYSWVNSYTKYMYWYDSGGRLVKRTTDIPSDAGLLEKFIYDKNGILTNIIEVRNFEDNTALRYDENGNIIEEKTTNILGVIKQVDYVFEYYR